MPEWALPVPLLPDELLSSWLARAALRLGCDPLVMSGCYFGKERIWARDFDRIRVDERFSPLLGASGLHADVLYKASLWPVAEKYVPGKLGSSGVIPWILATGARNRKRYGGLQACPSCLREDAAPYYRQQWRLAWHTVCTRHEVQLLDCCPRCRIVFEPHRLEAKDRHLSICASCKADLREFTGEPAPAAAMAFQRTADEVLNTGAGVYGKQVVPVGEWLVLARYFTVLIRRSLAGRSSGLAAVLGRLGAQVPDLKSPETGLPLELLPTGERAMLLSGVWGILTAGPGRLVKEAVAVGIAVQSLRGDRRAVFPECLTSVLSQLPTCNRKPRGKPNRQENKPISRERVLSMLAKLYRKANTSCSIQ